MENKLINFIENSFLKPLLLDKEITDISYNGVNIFYVDNKLGRQKSKIKLSNNEALDFIRQIANFSEKQFSYTCPFLDVSIGRYRINAAHQSIVRVDDEKACSFSIRIGSKKNRINEDKSFLNKENEKFLLDSLNNEESLIIAGPTGCGKTELQKYLLSKLRENTRVIVIDNILELENVRSTDNLDLTSWQVSPNNPNGSINELIRNALRSNPDWLVIAEARAEEMNDVLNSVLTGHPIITTLHAKTIEEIPLRITRMVEMKSINQKHEDILKDVISCFKKYVFLNRKMRKDGKVERYIEKIAEANKDGSLKLIYEKK